MTHRSLGVGGYDFGGPRACPWGSTMTIPYIRIGVFNDKIKGVTGGIGVDLPLECIGLKDTIEEAS